MPPACCKKTGSLNSFSPESFRGRSLMRRIARSPIDLMLCLWIGGLMAGAADATQVCKQIDSMGREYFLFIPDKIDPAATYWLVVEVHGYGGHGSEGSGVRRWVDRGDCIGVAPSFPDSYQRLDLNTDVQLVRIFQKLQTDFKLHGKLFLYGHSGGAQFCHRFAIKYPQLVAGCCSTSAGSWATGGIFGSMTPIAAGVPIAISCGELDTDRAAQNMPMSRIEWAKKFEEELGVMHCFYKAVYWPNAGHEGNSAGNEALANEAFSLGTSGMVGKDREDWEKKLKTLSDLVHAGKLAQAMTGCADLLRLINARDPKETANNLAAAGWRAGTPGISACIKTAQEFVAGQVQKLSGDIEKTGLEQVVAIEKGAAPNALMELQSLCNTFNGMIKVREAASQASFRLRASLR